MTISQLEAILNTVFPTKYSHFTGKMPLPAITYLVPDTTALTADNTVVSQTHSVEVELYTVKRDEAAENLLEQALSQNGIVYSGKQREFIQSENFHQTVYEFDITEKI